MHGASERKARRTRKYVELLSEGNNADQPRSSFSKAC
jgi:hypothetical protein